MDDVIVISSENEDDQSSSSIYDPWIDRDVVPDIADKDNENEMDVEQIVPKDNATIAEEKKKQGNELYKAQSYDLAVTFYSEAISLCPDTASYYSNRAACYMMLANYTKALEDSRKAIKLDINFEKAYLRTAKCYLALGDIAGTEQTIKNLLQIDPKSTALKNEQQLLVSLKKFEESIQTNYNKKSYRNVVFYLDSALKIATGCQRYRLLKAECLALLGRCDEAADIAVNIMKSDSSSADAIYIRGLCLYYTDNLEKGILHFERCLQLDPDHKKAKELRTKSRNLKEMKDKGNTLFKTGRYREAHTVYTDALKIDELNKDINSKLLYNRALVNSKIGLLRDTISDCTRVLEINSQYLKALLLRARCYNDLEKYEECVNDYEAALQIQKTAEITKLLRDAKFALKKSKRKDYYKILGIPRHATDDDIKKAYHKKALIHHPDRHASKSAEERKDEEIKFKEVGEAYAILSDERKKMRYDSGQDLTAQDHSEFDTNQMFQHFFRSGPKSYAFNF